MHFTEYILQSIDNYKEINLVTIKNDFDPLIYVILLSVICKQDHFLSDEHITFRNVFT